MCFYSKKTEINRFWYFIEKGYPFILFDVETTGLKKTDYIVQFSGIKCIKNPETSRYIIKDQINEYIKPPFIMGQEVIDVHHITNEFLADKPNEYQIFNKIHDWLNEAAVVSGYNVGFDIKMVKALCERNETNYEPPIVVDAFTIVKEMMDPKIFEGKRKLSNIAEYLGLSQDIQFHSADDDILVTWRVMEKLLEIYKTTPIIPEYTKEKAKITSVNKWDKGKNKRIYVSIIAPNAAGEIYYDCFYSIWRNKDEENNIISKINMEQLEKDLEEIVKKAGFEKISQYRGNYTSFN